jgi:hypothetical protein
LPRHDDDRDAPLTGAGWPINIPTNAPKSTPQDQSPPTIFSENQKSRNRRPYREDFLNMSTVP